MAAPPDPRKSRPPALLPAASSLPAPLAPQPREQRTPVRPVLRRAGPPYLRGRRRSTAGRSGAARPRSTKGPRGTPAHAAARNSSCCIRAEIRWPPAAARRRVPPPGSKIRRSRRRCRRASPRGGRGRRRARRSGGAAAPNPCSEVCPPGYCRCWTCSQACPKPCRGRAAGTGRGEEGGRDGG